jgi:hypothetical protein
MGGSPTQVVLRPTNDRQVAMGDPNRASRADAIDDTHLHRHRPLASTALETINKQPAGWAGKYTGGADDFFGGQDENLRMDFSSLCLR